jgi:hypothetical protein
MTITVNEADIETVRDALKSLRRKGLASRYGGLGQTYQRAQTALEALERIEARLTERQLSVLEDT